MKSLQPDCLLTDHTHLHDPWEVDIVNFEEPRGRSRQRPTPTPRTRPRRSTPRAATTGSGRRTSANLMTVSDIVDDHLQRAGAAVDELPPQLPAQPRRPDGRRHRHSPGGSGRRLEPNTAAPAVAGAGTAHRAPLHSGRGHRHQWHAADAIDGLNDNNPHALATSGAFPQSITLNLGATSPTWAWWLRARVHHQRGVAAGAITSYAVLVSTDGATFTEATTAPGPPTAR